MPRKWIWGLVFIGGQCVALSGCTQFRPWEDLKIPFGKSPASRPMSAGKTSPEDGTLALARLCERRGDWQQAEKLYQELLQKTPEDRRLHHRLGVIAAQQGRFSQADEHFQRAMAIGQADVELLCDAGYSLYLQHRLQDAEAVLRQALELQPKNARACNNMGLVLGEQGRLDESLTMFKRAGKEADAYTNMGYVLAQLGDLEGSKKMYSHALTLDDSIRPAVEGMLQVAERQKQINEMILARKSEGAPDVRASHVVPASADAALTTKADRAIAQADHPLANVYDGAEVKAHGATQDAGSAGVELAAHDSIRHSASWDQKPLAAEPPSAEGEPQRMAGAPRPFASLADAMSTHRASAMERAWQPPHRHQEMREGNLSGYSPTPWPAPANSAGHPHVNQQPPQHDVLSTALEVPTQAEPWPAARRQAAGGEAGMRVEVSDQDSRSPSASQTVPASYEQNPFSWRNLLRRK